MSSAESQLLVERYRAAQQAQLDWLQQESAAAFGEELDPDNIVDSFGAVNDRIYPSLVSTQVAQQSLTAAMYQTMAAVQGIGLAAKPPLDGIAGTRLDGSDLRAGMDAFGPMVLGQISSGADLQTAIDFGRYALTRYADAEARGASDRESVSQEDRPEIIGWEGVVSPGACDLCQANDGEHGLDEEIYRHGNCNCDKVPIYDTTQG